MTTIDTALDRLADLAGDAQAELEQSLNAKKSERALLRGRAEASREALEVFLSTVGQVAEFQAATVASMIIGGNVARRYGR